MFRVKKSLALLILCGFLLCISSCGEEKPAAAGLAAITTVPKNTDTAEETTVLTEKSETSEITRLTSDYGYEETVETGAAKETERITEQTAETIAETTTVITEEPEITEETTLVTTKEPPYTLPVTDYKNTVTILGPNLIYVGESFDFDYVISHKNADRASVLWSVEGKGAELKEDGVVIAREKGDITLKITDVSNGLSDSLTVHLVESPEDVDFVTEVNGIPIANKTYPIPADYNPGLDTETYERFMELKTAAAKEGIEINFMSGFRSYSEQVRVYKGWVEKYGEEADRVSARPGHSEHQLGLAIDVNETTFDFADTPEGMWLRENCYKYGFILRYPSFEAEAITGYMYEPWHIRYLGDEMAYNVHFSGLTLEEYLGIDSQYRIKNYVLNEE